MATDRGKTERCQSFRSRFGLDIAADIIEQVFGVATMSAAAGQFRKDEESAKNRSEIPDTVATRLSCEYGCSIVSSQLEWRLSARHPARTGDRLAHQQG
jgi:hypothetical protein